MQTSVSWLVIGIGDITTRRVIPAILEESRSRLYGILTRHPAKAAPYGVKVFTDLDAALKDSSIDVMIYSILVCRFAMANASQAFPSALKRVRVRRDTGDRGCSEG